MLPEKIFYEFLCLQFLKNYVHGTTNVFGKCLKINIIFFSIFMQ